MRRGDRVTLNLPNAERRTPNAERRTPRRTAEPPNRERLQGATVSRPLSHLIYHRVQEGSGSPRVITLHKDKQFAADVQEYGLAAAPDGRIIDLQSYQGVYVGRDIVGYTWYIGPLAQPSPIYFGDGLAEIERFLWDEVDRQRPGPAELPFLIAVEQGAVMALAAAAAVPDLLSGVIAIDGFFPVVPGWTPPLAPLDGLPILLLGPDRDIPPVADVLDGTALAETLTAWGWTVEQAAPDNPADAVPGAIMADWIGRQRVRTRS